MEEKKTAQANLERDRSTYFLMGLVVVLASFFVLLEWESEEVLSPDWIGFEEVFIEQEYVMPDVPIAPTVQPETEAVPPRVVYDDFQVVDEVQPSEEIDVPVLEAGADEAEQQPEPIVEPTVPEENPIYEAVEVDPQYPGGQIALVNFIYDNLIYPTAAVKLRQQGQVWCSFVVNTDGSISELKIEQGAYPYLDNEALMILRLMPPWIPGTVGGQRVRTKVYLPILFKL